MEDLEYKPGRISNSLDITCTKLPKNLPSSISYFQLFRFSTTKERFIIILGIFFATVAAFGLPLNVIIYGEYTTLLVDRTVRIYKSTPTLVIWIFGGGRILTNASVEENRLAIIEDAQAFGLAGVIITLIQFVACIIAVDLTNYTATKLSNRLRRIFLQAVLHQDMEWYDTSTDNNFAVKITEDIEKLKEGTGDKLAIFTYLVMSFVICVALSFVYGWKLTLVILTCAPLIIVATALVAKVQATLTEKELKSYSVAGRIAEEVLSAIRTVVALGGQLKEQDRYNKCLEPSLINGMKKGLFSGLGSGIMWLIIYCCYALAFWYGVGLILDDRDLEDRNYTPAVLIIVLFGVLAGAQNLGFSSPHLEAFATAKGSARNIYSIIERVPAINSLSTEGVVIKGINGNIEFKNVTFKYPARTNAPVLQGLTFSIKTGTTVALVGSSGCGKSTCIQLLQRNYDPLNGEIKIDGMNITQMNVGALRSFIGVVGQEPVLFSTTIGENIRYGKPSATNFDVQEAAKLANCHDFISKLPNGYHTVVGERGSQLSGGQKQRIALARALIRNPAILLLDEATSALDPHSEKKVQQALNKASQGRTTIIVTHRLSTITSAHKIVYIKDGRVIEQGTHTQLLQLKNEYYNLINAQSVISSEKEISKKSVIRRLSSRALSSHASDSDDECSEPDINVNDTIEEIYPVSLMRLLKINSPEWFYILIGCVAAVFVGASLPTFAILFGEFYGILSLPDKEDVQNRANTFSFFFIALGVITGAGTFVQTYAFNVTGVRLTSRLRQWAFKAMLSQEMNWFDDTRNSVGALCARLSGDCASVQGATGIRIGAMLQAFSTLAFGIAVALFYSWKLTLVSLVGIPIVLAAIFLEARFTESSGLQEKKSLEAASRIAVEAISSIKTVASLGQEMHVMDRYMQEINTAEMSLRKRLQWRGLVFSLGQSAPFFAYSLALYYGGLLVANEGLPYENVIKVSEALIFGAWMLGQSLAYVPNVNIAIISAGRLLKLLDRNPKIVELPLVTRQDEFRAENITFKNIEFSYPSRVNHPVLQNFNLSIGKNQTIALVGPSGCGKSTCIQLLLRFYDPASGRIELNEVSSLVGPVKKLREKFGLVSQEPVLFDKTISENISYGDNTREISMLEIFEAAKMANIHDFIISLPNGYETSLGPAGTQLSGGQKQRIAIARALIRNPQILLLDEATSALDAQSEKVVQQALDKASSGRTCIIIAHRLSTVQNADLICVLNNGAIVECGTHSELLVNGKMYAKLHKMQQIA